MSEDEWGLEEPEEGDNDESEDNDTLTKMHLTLLLTFFGIMITIFAFTESWYNGLRILNEGITNRSMWVILGVGTLIIWGSLEFVFNVRTNKEVIWSVALGFFIAWVVLMAIMFNYPSSYQQNLEAQNEINVENLDSINGMLNYNITMFSIDFNNTGNYSIKLYTSMIEDKCLAYDFYADGLEMSYEFDRTTVSEDMRILVIENVDTGSIYTARLNFIYSSIFGG